MLEEVLAALPLPALVVDQTERIVAINPGAQALVGVTAMGRHFITVLRQPSVVEAVENCLRDGDQILAQFLTGQNDSDTTYEVSVAPVGQSGMVMVGFKDVTHVTAAEVMRRDFVANVSHELRTPLTSLMGFIETLRGPARDDAAARERFLSIMSGEAERMNRLVGDLLSLSRVESEERVRPRSLVDLQQILNATMRNIKPLADEAQVALKNEAGQEALMIVADADQLQQVFTNLVENAIKYGGPNKTVTVTTYLSARDPLLRGPAVRVAVRDEGPGIDPAHLPRLTERFYRIDSHRSRALGGTGLGLAIVKHILNRHRGRLKVESQVGKGSIFNVLLPLAELPA